MLAAYDYPAGQTQHANPTMKDVVFVICHSRHPSSVRSDRVACGVWHRVPDVVNRRLLHVTERAIRAGRTV